MIPPLLLAQWKLIAGALLAAGIFYGGWYARGVVVRAEKATALEEQSRQREAEAAEANIKAAELEALLAGFRASNRTLETQLARARRNPAYAPCVVPVDGVRLFNSAASGAGSGKPAGEMPGH